MRGVWRWKSYHLIWSPWESLRQKQSTQLAQELPDPSRYVVSVVSRRWNQIWITANWFGMIWIIQGFSKLFQTFTCDRGFKPGSHHAKHSKSQTVRWHLEIVHVQTMIQTCSNSFYVERVWESGNNRLSQVGLRLMWRLEDGPGFSFLDTIWIWDQRTQRKHPITQQVPWTRLYDIAWFIQWYRMILHDAAWCCSFCILRQKVQELGIQLEDQARQALASLPHEHAEELLEQLGRNSAQQLPNRLGSIQILCIFPQSVIYVSMPPDVFNQHIA